MTRLFLGFVLAFISTTFYAQTQQAYVAPGDLRTFLDYNLGADTSLPSTTPSLGIKGDKYQWGIPTKISSSTDWSAAPAPDTALSDVTKTANDPCPTGYRLPTGSEWQGLIANNSIQWVGNFYEDGWGVYNRHTSGLLINNSLFLPAAGSINVGGTIASNNASGVYYSSTALGYLDYVQALVFYWAGQMPSTSKSIQVNPLYKPRGGNIRCIKEIVAFPLVLNTKETNQQGGKAIIYPNPAKNSFSVALKNKSKVELYDNLGKKVISKVVTSGEEVNIQSLNKGTYHVKISNGKDTYKETLLKSDY